MVSWSTVTGWTAVCAAGGLGSTPSGRQGRPRQRVAWLESDLTSGWPPVKA